MICYFILLINSILLEGLLSNIFKGALFMFFISTIFVCYLINDNKKYMVITILLSILYDILYSSSFFISTFILIVLFKLLSMISIKKVYKAIMFYITMIIINVINTKVMIENFIIVNSIYVIITYVILKLTTSNIKGKKT